MTTASVAGTLKGLSQTRGAEDDMIAAKDRAFSMMVEEFSDLAYNVALKMMHNADEAEDAVQDAFLSAYRSFSSFKGDSKLSTWLYRIVVNACLMKIRKNKTRSKYFTDSGYDDAIVYDWSNDPERAAKTGELRDAIQEGLSKISADLRAAIVLRDVQEFSSEEAAEILNISVAALKSRLHRGRLMLRKHLEGVWNEM